MLSYLARYPTSNALQRQSLYNHHLSSFWLNVVEDNKQFFQKR